MGHESQWTSGIAFFILFRFEIQMWHLHVDVSVCITGYRNLLFMQYNKGIITRHKRCNIGFYVSKCNMISNIYLSRNQQSTLTSTTNWRGSTTTPLKCWRSFFSKFQISVQQPNDSIKRSLSYWFRAVIIIYLFLWYKVRFKMQYDFKHLSFQKPVSTKHHTYALS
jgi:hypothetical protein